MIRDMQSVDCRVENDEQRFAIFTTLVQPLYIHKSLYDCIAEKFWRVKILEAFYPDINQG